MIASLSALLLTSATVQRPPDNPLLGLAYEAQQERRALAKDQFSAVKSHEDAVGTPFAVSISESDNPLAFLALYKEGILEMRVAGTEFYYSEPLTDHIEAFEVSSRKVSSREYKAQNAFGAKATVYSITTEDSYLAATHLPRGNLNPQFPDNSEVDEYVWTKAVSGPEAKRLLVSSRLTIEDKISRLPNGKVTSCKSLSGQATIQSPTEYTAHECYVAAEVSRIAIYGGDGVLLKEWR